MTMGNIGQMKKNALLEVFKEMASAEIDSSRWRFTRALWWAHDRGLQTNDIAWVGGLSGAEFKKIYGDDALPAELTARMKKHDDALIASKKSPRFPGFYPA
jgi:hypothetical protein